MSHVIESTVGVIGFLWRYPVKSMLGEQLDEAEVTERGIRGDRVYALIDSTDEKVASAKNPRKWPNLFAFRAAVVDHAAAGGEPPLVRITLPDGAVVTTDQPDLNRVLSKALGREVTLESTVPPASRVRAETYWPDIEGLKHRDAISEFRLEAGTFFDSATVHLLTTATLRQLHEAHPDGRFEPQRFRPNIVVETADVAGFPEDAWIGHTLAIGDDVRLRVTGPCPRCVMTTLAQGDLPKDSGILRAVVQRNRGNVGMYAEVARGGAVRRGDRVTLVK